MTRRTLAGLAAAALFAVSGGLRAQTEPAPEFVLGFDGPCGQTVEGAPNSPFATTLTATMTTNNPPGDDGAQGWSVSIAAENLSIDAVTITGTAAEVALQGGFNQTETTMAWAEGSECEGLNGAVSAIVLNLINPVTLPVDVPSNILVLDVSGQFPEENMTTEGRVFFADGCQGSGQPVSNVVTWRGASVTPVKGECTISLFGKPGPVPCCDAPISLVFLPEVVSSENLFDGTVAACDDLSEEGNTLTVEVPPGEAATTNVYAGIVSNLAEGGVQGWSISIAVGGDVTPTSATIEGTAAEKALTGGFNQTETVDPTKPNPPPDGPPQGDGVVSAIVLDLINPVTLPPVGTETILCISLQADRVPVGEGDEVLGTVEAKDGLIGSGQPVSNVATVGGSSQKFCFAPPLTVRFIEQPPPPVSDFIRCDPNNDGSNNIADAVWIVNELFRNGPPTLCPAAADCNADGMEDLTDAIYAVEYQFLGGPPPSAPFPDCGGSELILDNPDLCPAGSTICSEDGA